MENTSPSQKIVPTLVTTESTQPTQKIVATLNSIEIAATSTEQVIAEFPYLTYGNKLKERVIQSCKLQY